MTERSRGGNRRPRPTEPKLDSQPFSRRCAVGPSLSEFAVPMSFRHHSHTVSSSFRCRFGARCVMKLLRWNDPQTEITLVLKSFNFRTTRNDEWSSFDGTTERCRNDHRCWGMWSERSRTWVERSATTSRSVSRSCHSNRVPRSVIVLHRSGKRGGIGTTSERGRNGGGGRAKVG